ncbi:hypothetical protein ACXYTB_22280, partial [Escherichia coli]|nr:hypothetical protein [Escherichia sp. S10b]
GTADRNRSHWSTSKTPSYTKSVSWQHHRGYDYPVDFPRLIQEKRKEWEQIAGIPVAEVF